MSATKSKPAKRTYVDQFDMQEIMDRENANGLPPGITQKFYATPEYIARENTIKTAIMTAIHRDGGNWTKIVSRVRQVVTIQNWLTEVRGPLQGLINDGIIFRSGGVWDETYSRVVSKTAIHKEIVDHLVSTGIDEATAMDLKNRNYPELANEEFEKLFTKAQKILAPIRKASADTKKLRNKVDLSITKVRQTGYRISYPAYKGWLIKKDKEVVASGSELEELATALEKLENNTKTI